MYLKNNKNFLYIFIIATVAYHEQFLSVNVNNEEEKKEENNEPGLKKKYLKKFIVKDVATVISSPSIRLSQIKI